MRPWWSKSSSSEVSSYCPRPSRMFDRVETDIDAPLLEAGLAVAEVIAPEPPEAVVKPQRRDRRPARMKAQPPFGKRPGIGFAEMFGLAKLEAGIGDGGRQRRIR